MSRLTRVTDLFVEGVALELGVDSTGTLVLVWVNKPNSFEVEEARRDGQAARQSKLMELRRPESPERISLYEQITPMENAQLVDALVKNGWEEDLMAAITDIESDKDWVDRREFIARQEALLEDADIAQDDDRRTQLVQVMGEYQAENLKRIADRQEERKTDLEALDRHDLEERYEKEWRERAGVEALLKEKRVTELWYSIRDCTAVKTEGGLDHSMCDHTVRLLETREQVRKQPEGFMSRILAALNDIEISPREAGNSDAPASSSASSGPQSEEEDSTASTPVETSSGVPGP